jgi:putative ABC transport system permease protein
VGIPRSEEIQLHLPVLWFAFALAALTGVACGIGPAVAATRVNLSLSLKEGGMASSGRSASRTRAALVVTETAAALVLLIGAVLTIGSYLRLADIDPGFRPANVVTAVVSPTSQKYRDPASQAALVDEIVRRVALLTGVVSAGIIDMTPLQRMRHYFEFEIAGRPVAPGDRPPIANIRVATPGYFRTLGIPLLRGRNFSERDGPGAPGCVIVSEALRRRFWPTEDPLGHKIVYPWGRNRRMAEIVGIAGDVRQWGLRDDYEPHLYFPYAQLPLRGQFVLVVRTVNDPAALSAAIRTEIAETDRSLPPPAIRTMESFLDAELAEQRYYAQLLGSFALLALALAFVGIYGVFSYSVAQQSHEIGIRMALGAGRGIVLRLVLGRALALAGIGVLVGIAGATALTRFLAGLLYGVTPTDPPTFAGVSLLLLAVALAAAYGPARRATDLEPVSALRS